MSALMTAAKAHFSELLDGDLQCLEVPEWKIAGQPAKIYYRPYMTVSDKGELIALYNEGKHYEMMVLSLIFSARDETGTRLLTKSDKFELMKSVHADVIEDIFTRMALFSVDDDGEAAKK